MHLSGVSETTAFTEHEYAAHPPRTLFAANLATRGDVLKENTVGFQRVLAAVRCEEDLMTIDGSNDKRLVEY